MDLGQRVFLKSFYAQNVLLRRFLEILASLGLEPTICLLFHCQTAK